jgi:cyclin C
LSNHFEDLLEDLEFHLIVYHPYRSLVQLCGRDGRDPVRCESMLHMDDTTLQMAWCGDWIFDPVDSNVLTALPCGRFVINDTFRSELCLLYPPHLIAVASIYLAFSLNPPAPVGEGTPTAENSVDGSSPSSSGVSAPVASRTRRQPDNETLTHPLPSKPGTATGTVAAQPMKPTSGKAAAVPFLASLNVQMPLVLEIVQEIVALYSLWQSLEEPEPAGGTTRSGKSKDSGPDERVIGILKRMRAARQADIG